MRCSNCGAQTPDDSIFCPSCGSRAEKPANLCVKCHMPLVPGAQFCNNCGTPALIAPAAPAAPASAGAACPQCGNKLLPGIVFCSNCGTRQTAAPAYAQQQPAAVPYAAAQPYVQPPYANPYANPYAQQIPAAQPPRKKKGLLVALIIVLAVLIVGGGVYALFGRQIKRAIMGPKAAYLSIEGKAMKDSAANFVDDLAAYGNQEERPETGGTIIDINLDLDEAALGLDAQTATAINNITIKSTMMYDRAGSQPLFYDKLDFLTSDEPLMTMEGFYDNGQLVIGFPGILDKALVMTGEEISGLLGTAGVDSSQAGSGISLISSLTELDLGIDEAEMKRAMNKIVDIMLEHIDETKFAADQVLEAGDVSVKYDLYTITVEKESARQMILEILELVRDDQQFYNLASQIAAYSATASGSAEPEFSLDDYQTAIDEAIGEVGDPDSSEEDFTLVQEVYVGKDDEVFGRDLLITDADGNTMLHFIFANPSDGGSEAFRIYAETEDATFEYLSSYQVVDGKKTGEAVMTVDDGEVMRVSFEDLVFVYQEDGTLDKMLGTLDFRFEVPEESLDTTIAAPDGFSISGVMDDDRYVLSLGVDSLFGIKIGIEEIAAGDVQFPAYDPNNLVSISDSTALSELITPDVMEKLMAIVGQLGLMPVE